MIIVYDYSIICSYDIRGADFRPKFTVRFQPIRKKIVSSSIITIIILSTYTFTEDTSDKKTNEKDIELTPENTKARTAEVGSSESVARKLSLEDGKSVFVIYICNLKKS